ncbi:MAG TPA: AraC family transcriptional regulator [Mobilitalea sp.]|nr:AraC family transcriptional regulator [Mobilitalea sp.]
MDWVSQLNKAIGYIERNLDGEIDYDEVACITVCPIGLFQRLFVLAAGYTLTEYIRRRRLTRALEDLRTTNQKVVDIAFKYGYETSDAFGVAFKRLYGVTPTQARQSSDDELRHYDRIYFNLTITYIKGDKDMVLVNIDNYRYYDPLFEGVRIILSYMGEKYSSEYIQGISGSAFKIAGGCPSRPTCIYDRWTPDFIRYLGFDITELPCYDKEGKDISETMIAGVKRHIDGGKPALVWHAFTNAEWDVVCGYDEDAKQFIGRGTYLGRDDYHRESWNRFATCDVAPVFGAILINGRKSPLNEREAEIASLVGAVKHARHDFDEDGVMGEGIKFYKRWADEYSHMGKDRGVADAYCYDVYSSVRKAAVVYLREIGHKYGGSILENLKYAELNFEREVELLAQARPYLSWESPWGVNEERSVKLAPILNEAADSYEKGIEYIEKTLECLNIKI